MRLKLATFALSAGLALLATRAFAHGGHDHVMGTVKVIDLKAGTVEVETRDGKRVLVFVNDKTKYLRGGAAARSSDLTTDLRVVIDAGKTDGKLVAKEIRLAPAKRD